MTSDELMQLHRWNQRPLAAIASIEPPIDALVLAAVEAYKTSGRGYPGSHLQTAELRLCSMPQVARERLGRALLTFYQHYMRSVCP